MHTGACITRGAHSNLYPVTPSSAETPFHAALEMLSLSGCSYRPIELSQQNHQFLRLSFFFFLD